MVFLSFYILLLALLEVGEKGNPSLVSTFFVCICICSEEKNGFNSHNVSG
jgi:hypothetical protein